GEKIAFVPVGSRSQFDARRALRSGTIARHLANDISSASFLETNRHFRESISTAPSEAKPFAILRPGRVRTMKQARHSCRLIFQKGYYRRRIELSAAIQKFQLD